MEAVGDSVLSICFERIIHKSIDLLKYVDHGQVQGQLNKWEKMLRRIYAALDDAEEKQTNNRRVEIWLTDLKQSAYDIEDVLDELETEVRQRKLEDEDDNVRPSKVRRIMSSIGSIFSAVNSRRVLFNVEMVAKIEEIKVRLDEIVKQKDDLYLGDSNRRRVGHVSERLPSTSLADEAEVYGREEDKKAMLQLLKADAGDVDVGVVPIIGMGGIGKTTLGQLIYNDPTMEFDLKAWVCVGEDFNVLRITQIILQSDDKDLNSLQEKLKQKLLGKKFLVILDDVWCENYEQWDRFLIPLKAGASGSRIIITTRNVKVSSVTGTLPAYPLKELSYNECLSVFAQHALGATDFHQHLDLEEIGKEIVKRCKGLPLAAKALGGLLRGNQNVNAWNEVLNSEIWDFPENKTDVLPALMLSYFHLPPHLKRCFAYCSVFPKDYMFDRNELVLLWKAEGFLSHSNVMKHTEDLGHRYFDDLLSRSFFQQSNDNKSRYLMHDLISDLACSVSRDICFHLVDNKLKDAKSYANIRHSSFIPHNYNIFQRFECFFEMKKLRTFLSIQNIRNCSLSNKVLHDLLPKLKCLRVLSLTGYRFKELPSSVGELKLLKYLDLSRTFIVRLPESMGELFNLETLRLCGCHRLIELPKSICNLINLEYLDISGTYNLKEMPLQIGNLTSLRRLSKFIVGEGNNGQRIVELKKFSQLEGMLQIEGLQNVVDARDADFVNLKEKPGLTELHLQWTDDSFDSRNSTVEVQVLNSLKPHSNLSVLSILGFGGRQFPSWIGDPIFANMAVLKLVGCRNITSLPPLGRLPSLKELSIEGMKEWVQWYCCNVVCEDSLGKFHELRELRIQNCPKLVGQLPSFLPSLEVLDIRDCPQLVDSPKWLPSLVRLFIFGCQGAVLRNLCDVPRLTELKIQRMVDLIRLDEIHIQALAALQNLQIWGCDELKYLWDDGTKLDYLTSLKSLSIRKCEQLLLLVNGEEGLLPCNLESLGVYSCKKLKELPNGLHSLKSLKDLSVEFCGDLVSFPASGLPYGLKRLNISECNSLKVLYLSETPHLETLEVKYCNSVCCPPNARFSDSLKIFKIPIMTIQLLETLYYGFSRLTILDIWGCDELESFPTRELHIPTLISLTIFDCKRLKSLSNHMQSLHRLQHLSISFCDEFVWFPETGLPNPSLVSFRIYYCRNLRSLPNQMQKNLTSLQSLKIKALPISSLEGCLPPSLQSLEIKALPISSLEGCLPPKLTELAIIYSKNLSQPMAEWGLHTLTSLGKLTIEGPMRSTTDMVSFPDDEGLLLPTSLTELSICNFENLESISGGIQELTSLRNLIIYKCPKLKCFPDEGLPPTLEFLYISGSPLLEKRCSKDKRECWPIISHIPCCNISAHHSCMVPGI